MSDLANTLIFESDALTVRSIAVSEMENNVYLLTHRASGGQVLIDAADDFPAINTFVQQAAAADSLAAYDQAGAGVRALVTTHSHWDHIRALPEAVETWDPATYCGAPDAEAIAEQESVEVEERLVGGEHLTLAGIELEVIALRGHTPGSIALALRVPDGADAGERVLLFTGDSLFPGGVGKTNSPQDFEQLFADVSERIFGRFDDNTLVLPGHGDSTTLGKERPQLPKWKERGW
ncbi:MBL fold metallo-hydrolase [Rothia nasimurium]|uniref:MBL fold metallo-hydrolase n=1 Tax=Rothia nasimurium TaxID=85336 RepID=A0A4Y9F6T8_9MICC|nr:MBL fold metallo-hydrolase [Rothia nasimurium]MBF0807946.1 MBL fold metallo-hydrolase [Rothia nasimurium]TFU22806.1 MBL fold metallo-hydrolase [Rothia nasimurium]